MSDQFVLSPYEDSQEAREAAALTLEDWLSPLLKYESFVSIKSEGDTLELTLYEPDDNQPFIVTLKVTKIEPIEYD